MGYVLGVDLGTTYSAAAIADGDRCEIVQLGTRAATMPSVVFLREDGELLVGEVAERRASADPARAAREFKRRIGDPAPLILGGTPYSAEGLAGFVLKDIVTRVTEERGAPPERLTVTHPATYGQYKLDLMRQMVSHAGCEAATFLPEPVAAALHYASQERIDAGLPIAVYDFGGGTFDAAMLRKSGDSFEILGRPEGMERLGGVDFDEAVFSHVAETIGRAVLLGDDSASARAALSRLREECRAAKESLSSDTETTISVLLPSAHSEVRLTRRELEDALRPRIRETAEVLARCMRSANLTPKEVDRILLVGGSSRIPLVGQVLREAFGRPISRDSHPKHTIALGAALYSRDQADRGTVTVAVPATSAPQQVPTPAPPAAVQEPGTAGLSVAATGREPSPPAAPAVTAPPAAAPQVAEVGPPVAATGAAAAIPGSLKEDAPRPARASRSVPRWVWAAAGIAVLATVAGVAALFLGGGGEAAARARITDAELEAGVYTVWFETENASTGDGLVFYWNNQAPSSGATWTGGSPVQFTFSRPAGATRLCIAVVSDGAVASDSGNCWTV